MFPRSPLPVRSAIGVEEDERGEEDDEDGTVGCEQKEKRGSLPFPSEKKEENYKNSRQISVGVNRFI
ncbi:hypothetical protein L1987_73023 [Smallanthus sonchifolius]|uniref:Uncharacterized protein n=1 Tax=Smallanthus sonchifolius TaxID=185202 RepID=A0ACB9AXH5_9ASTR|nr:hypothetical protein L1987_73023 [Smallanthus sonchifolius]